MRAARRRSPSAPQLAVVLALSLTFLVVRYSVFLDVKSPHFTSPQWDFQHLFWLLQVRVDVALAGGLPHWDHGLGGGYVLLENPQSLAWHPASLAVVAALTANCARTQGSDIDAGLP